LEAIGELKPKARPIIRIEALVIRVFPYDLRQDSPDNLWIHERVKGVVGPGNLTNIGNSRVEAQCGPLSLHVQMPDARAEINVLYR